MDLRISLLLSGNLRFWYLSFFFFFPWELSSPGENRQRDSIVHLVVSSSFLWCWGQRNGKRMDSLSRLIIYGSLGFQQRELFLMNCVYFSFFHFSLFSAPLLHDALFARTENLYLLIERSYKTVCSSASAFLYKYRVFCGYLEFWLEMTPWKSQTALLHDRPEMGCRRVLKKVWTYSKRGGGFWNSYVNAPLKRDLLS